MKIVAVSQRVDGYPERNESRDALDQRVSDFLLVAGFLAVPVPNQFIVDMEGAPRRESLLLRWLTHVQPHAIVLSGGNDIGTCTSRDQTEAALLDYAATQRLPVLGICRGMQMMGTLAGTTLRTHSGHVRTRHMVSGEITREVNSFHNQSLVSCPEQFKVLARSADGEIEAIRHQSLSWEGWMWHPERELPYFGDDVARVRILFAGR